VALTTDPSNEGIFSIRGTDADWFPGYIQFDTPVVSYSWTIYTTRTASTTVNSDQPEILTLAFD
jgi:hypothetical protein